MQVNSIVKMIPNRHTTDKKVWVGMLVGGGEWTTDHKNTIQVPTLLEHTNLYKILFQQQAC